MIFIHNGIFNVRPIFKSVASEKINKHLPTPITPREFEVLQLIYEGQTNRQIAETLFVSTNTIKRHINNAYLALEATSRSTAIARLRELMLK